MNNNDILRRLRFAFDFSDRQLLALFSADSNSSVFLSKDALSARLKKDTEAEFITCSDTELAALLDGLIVAKRGVRKNGTQNNANPLVTTERLTKNDVLKKLRIALGYRDDDMLETLKLGGASLSKSEFSALFRTPDHKHFRTCGNQILRAFLKGLTKRLRPNIDAD